MQNFGNILGGAATGAGLGSPFGLPGMGIGALLGGVGSLFGLGKSQPEQFKQLGAITPQMLNPLNQQGFSALQQLLNYQPESLEAMQAPALEQFQQQIIPGILERFAGLGAGSSSALNQTLGEAAKGLGTNLAALRAEQLQGAANTRLNALQQLLNLNQLQTQGQYKQEAQPGLLELLSPIAAQVFAQSPYGQKILPQGIPQGGFKI